MPSKESSILMMEKEYEKRLKRWGSIKIFELKPSNKSDSERQKLENNAFLELMKPGTLPILLDEGGKMVTTKQIAESIQHWQLKGIKRVILGIGSANGWSDEIKKTTKEVWSLSKLTFPYQLARLILIEQLYRAFSIINNSPYHRE